MIDYEKLKEAHELAEHVAKTHKICIDIKIKHSDCEPVNYVLTVYNEDPDRDYNLDWYNNIDDLLHKLRELTGPQTKYKEGDYVWLMGVNNIPVDLCIEDVDLESDERYLIEDAWFREDKIYPSREALIEAQITYWKGLQDATLTNEGTKKYHAGFGYRGDQCSESIRKHHELQCEHEPRTIGDCVVHYASNPPQLQCVKCGEFYR